MKCKEFLKRFIITILIISIIFSFFTSSLISNATEGLDGGSSMVDQLEDDPPDDEQNLFATVIQFLLGSVVGLFSYPVRLIALYTSRGINALTASVAYIEGSTIPNDKTINTRVITPFDIFFNKVALLDINFFNTDNVSTESLMYKFRSGIAVWYYILKAMSLSMLLVVLIYVGIRMAISTVSSEKARYKKMLIDWATSMVILFLTTHVISFVLLVNNSIVNAISLMCNSLVISDTFRALQDIAFKVFDPLAIAATVVYCILVWQTIALVISYFTRMLKIAFLVLISPLITITYSIDKIGDGKAQALGTWLKEFVYTVLIQPFHCIIYMVFVNISFKLLLDNQLNQINSQTIAAAVISILSILFVKDAEKIVKKIFNFQDDGTGTSILTGAAVATLALNKAKGIGSGTRSVINKTAVGMGLAKDSAKNILKNTKNLGKATVDAALIHHVASKKEKDGMTREEAVNTARTERFEEKAKKAEVKELARSLKKSGHKKHRKEIRKEIDEKFDAIKSEETKKLIDNNTSDLGLDDVEIEALGSLYAVQRMQNQGMEERSNMPKKQRSRAYNRVKGKTDAAKTKIKGVTSGVGTTVGKFREIYRKSSVAQDVGNTAKKIVGKGFGMAVGGGVMGLTEQNELLTGYLSSKTTQKGVNAFFNTSAKNSANEMDNNLRAMGVESAEEAAIFADDIVTKYEDNSGEKELEAYGKELINELKNLGLGDMANVIKSQIDRGIVTDPTKTQQVISYAFKKAGLSSTDSSKALSSAQKYARAVNEREFYKKCKAQLANGYSLDVTIKKVVSNFDRNTKYYDSDSESSANESRVRSMISDEYVTDDAQLQSYIDELEIQADRFVQEELVKSPAYDPDDELSVNALNMIEKDLELARTEALHELMVEFKRKNRTISNSTYERIKKSINNSIDYANQKNDKAMEDKLRGYLDDFPNQE